MFAIPQGKTLGAADLSIYIREETGALYNPSLITYSLFAVDRDTRIETLVSTPNLIPASDGTGIFHVNMTVPTTWIGEFKLVWYINRYADSPVDTVTEEFQVVEFTPGRSSFEAPSVLMVSKPGISDKTAGMIMLVRELLSDTNPDRNYHFRPPTPGKTVAGFNARFGFIWNDDTIIRMLRLAINQLNLTNPKNIYDFTIDSIPEAYTATACIGAAAKCLSAEAARWAAEEFSYSLNGVSLDINKAQTYQQLAGAYAEEFKELAQTAMANKAASVGLRQQRWLI